MNQMALIVATLHWPGWARCINTWVETSTLPLTRRVFAGMPLLDAYQQGFEESQEPILGFVHDDVLMQEKGWDQRVLAEFEDPAVGLVGFGGALGHGDPDMYKKPYELSQLARRNFLSNMREAEAHGERFTGERDVACLDGFAIFARRQLLEKIGGCLCTTCSLVLYVRRLYLLRGIAQRLSNSSGRRICGPSLGGRSTGWGKTGSSLAAMPMNRSTRITETCFQRGSNDARREAATGKA